jgi:arylsulfatase A
VKTVYAMISVMDAGIGRVLQTLADERLLEHTVVIITSDHGPDLSGSPQFSEQPTPGFARDNGGLRGGKGLVFEGGIRVPAVVHWSDGLGDTRVVHAPTHHIDFVPTLLDLVGIPAAQRFADDDPPLDGQSILGTLRGEAPEVERTLAWQWNRYQPIAHCNMALRSGQWKLVWPPLSGALEALAQDSAADRKLDKDETSPVQPYSAEVRRVVAEPTAPLLFNLETDPGETTDVASTHPHLVAHLVDDLDNWFAEVEAERASVVAAGFCD